MECKKQGLSTRRYKIEDNINVDDKGESTHDPLLEFDSSLPDDLESRRMHLVFKSTMFGRVDHLKAVLNHCPNVRELVNSYDLNGCTALHMAARFNQVEVAEVLISFGADCNKNATACSTPLVAACRYNSENTVRLLLKHGSDPLKKLEKGMNALHAIALYSTVNMAEIVFGRKRKPPVNSTDDLGMTPLHIAAQFGKDDICLWLLRHGANPRALDVRRTTPLMLSSRFGHVTTIKTFLVFYGKDAQLKTTMLGDVDDEGMTALHHAVLGGRYQAVLELLTWGADTNAACRNGKRPLHICADDGHAQLVPILTSYLADLSCKDNRGRTPLHSAVEHKCMDVITSLLLQGADPNIQDSNYKTPLLIACLTNYVEAAKMLCQYGANLAITNFYGQTCLHSAIEVGNLEVFHLLLAQCGEKSQILEAVDIYGQTLLHMAATQTDIQFLDELLSRGCSATSRDVVGKLPLHVGARYGSYETVLRLMDVSPDVNVQCADGRTAFFFACQFGNRRTLSALLNNGANMNDTDHYFKSCLIAAVVGGFTDIVQDLIQVGVKVNYKDKERNTALHHACLHGRLSTVKVLLDHGACVSDTNIHGQTPLDVAVDQSRSDVAVMLMEQDSWEGGLSVPTKKGSSHTLNRMIENTPAAAKIVLDKCVRTSKHASTDEAYAIEFDYKYINQGYNCAFNCECVFVTMLNNNREELLSHPLCQSNLSFKWHTFGKAVFLVHAVLQLGFLLSLTTYYFTMPKPHDIEYQCTVNATEFGNYTDSSNMRKETSSYQPRFRTGGMYAVEYILYAFMAAHFTKDICSCFAVGVQYLKSAHFLLSLTVTTLTLYATMPPGFEPCDSQWRTISYALFIFFLKTSIMCQRLESVGVFFTMFTEVAKTMMKISVLTVFFIIAIAIPYSVMLNQVGFKSEGYAALSTFAMALGELNFRDNFISTSNGPFDFEVSVMFPICCIILNCSLINLMIGVAVGDISKVEKKAFLSRLRTHINCLVEAEKIISLIPRRRTDSGSKLVVRPNSKCRSFNETVRRAFLYCEQISFIKKNTVSGPMSEQEKIMVKELADQKSSIEKLCKVTDAIMSTLQKMNNKGQEDDHEMDQTPADCETVKEARMCDRAELLTK